MRFCTNWQIYADDITVRSGRVVDGVIYTDEEYKARVKDAHRRRAVERVDLDQAFKALGFDPAGLGVETDGKSGKPKRQAKARPKTKGEDAAEGRGAEATGDPSPRAHPSILQRFPSLLYVLLVWGSIPPVTGIFVIELTTRTWLQPNGCNPVPVCGPRTNTPPAGCTQA